MTDLTTLSVSAATAINTDTITTTGTQTYTGQVTLGASSSLTSDSGAIVFSNTINSADATARSLALKSTAAAQNFVGAVGSINALDILRIESAGVTEGASASIKAAKLAIKSSGTVTLENASNDVNVLAANLSGSASLSLSLIHISEPTRPY